MAVVCKSVKLFSRRVKYEVTKIIIWGDKSDFRCCSDVIVEFKLFDSLFHSVYLVFPKRLFSIADLFALRHLWDV